MQFVVGIGAGIGMTLVVPSLVKWWKTSTPLPKISRAVSESLEYQRGEICPISIQIEPGWSDLKSSSKVNTDLIELGMKIEFVTHMSNKTVIIGSASQDQIDKISKLCYVVYIAPAPTKAK